MTRKDYVLIAAALKASAPIIDNMIDDSGVRQSAQLQFAASVNSVAHALANDNPRFDHSRFVKAAGVQS